MKHLKVWKTSGSHGRKPFRRCGVIMLALTLAAYFLLPAWAAPTPSYDSLRLYTEALFEITQKYVWPKNESDLIYGSLRGMMNSLDPDSSFLTPKEYQDYLQGNKTVWRSCLVQRPFCSSSSTIAAISHMLEIVASSMDMVSRLGRGVRIA